MGGLFKTVGKLEVNNIAAWDGNKWHAMQNGTRFSVSQYLGNVTAMAVYKGNLIASGDFDTAGSVFCEQFAEWNGKNWSPLDNNSACSYALQMLPHDSLLYVVGNMYKFGPCLITHAATWNGSQWNDLNFNRGNFVYATTFFDGQLIIGFDKSYTNDDSTEQINYIAKADFATSTAAASKSNSFQLYPNPAQNDVTVSFPFSSNIITIYDLYGREIHHFKIQNGNSAVLNVHSLQAGVYVVSIKDEKGNLIASEKLFKE